LFSFFRDEEEKEAVVLTTVVVVKAVSKALSANTRQDLAGNLLLDFFFFQLGKCVRAWLKPHNNKNRVQTQRLFLGKTLCGLVLAFLKRVCSRSEQKSATALFFLILWRLSVFLWTVAFCRFGGPSDSYMLLSRWTTSIRLLCWSTQQ